MSTNAKGRPAHPADGTDRGATTVVTAAAPRTSASLVPTDESDAELLARVRGGEADAYGALWRRHVSVALVVAGQYATIADPEDIVQEAFQAVFTATANGAGPHTDFRPYLTRTVRNTAVDISRRKRAEPVGGMEEVAEQLDARAEAVDEQSVERMVLVRAFRSLPERWRTVLWLVEVEDIPVKEAAARLGLTSNGGAALALRAREGLRRAWLASHVAERDLTPECRWTVDHLLLSGRDASSARSRRLGEHTASCATCAVSAQEVEALLRRLPALRVRSSSRQDVATGEPRRGPGDDDGAQVEPLPGCADDTSLDGRQTHACRAPCRRVSPRRAPRAGRLLV